MTPRLVLVRSGFGIPPVSFHALGLSLEHVTVVRVMRSGSMNQKILLRAAVVAYGCSSCCCCHWKTSFFHGCRTSRQACLYSESSSMRSQQNSKRGPSPCSIGWKPWLFRHLVLPRVGNPVDDNLDDFIIAKTLLGISTERRKEWNLFRVDTLKRSVEVLSY